MAIVPDKEIKKSFKIVTSKNPDEYYATSILKEKGFVRNKCSKCGTFFWNCDSSRSVCDDPSCSGGFRFFDGNPAKFKLDYIAVWKRFSEMFSSFGYTPIDRYPVIARWRDDTEFVQASIYDFQPFVVSGEIEPPANPLVVPQFCLRFNDVDNVGVTMSHMTGFVMIGQHAFLAEKDWDQNKFFSDIYNWLIDGVGLPKEEITFHEDAWAGGGNFGPCMEFFCRGCELGNQVYMLFEQRADGKPKKIPLKVLDMGMGHERIAWFMKGSGTIYDATFPDVMNKLFSKTGVDYDESFIQKYVPFAAYLNVDEIEDVSSAWNDVAEKMGVSSSKLKDLILPLSSLYSVAEHSRTLLLALSDGGLPSNAGGGYNLRMILRRALRFIDKFNWNISLFEIISWHADYLKPLFPELSVNLSDIKQIIDFEKRKYIESANRNKILVEKFAKNKKPISTDKLISLYDSNGVTPEELALAAKKNGFEVVVPDNFYQLVTERHEKNTSNLTATKKEFLFDIEDVSPTDLLYFDHYDYVEFEAHIIKIIDDNKLILDRSAFYPTSGGQIHDVGTINRVQVSEVVKQTNSKGVVSIHILNSPFKGKVGDKVNGVIDFDRRLQLSQHHTATHILTGACRKVLGNHVWQAGASKTLDKSRLDISHFEQLSSKQLSSIESLANKVVGENRVVSKSFVPRAIAEKEFGFRLYQGGAVPGKVLRIVNIDGFDVEACGGTHLDLTGDVGVIKILKTSKIQDGVLRLEFVAGTAYKKAFSFEKDIISKASSLLGCSEKQLPCRASELFSKWKKIKKGKLDVFSLESSKESNLDVISELSSIFKTQPEHIVKTIERFLSDINKKLNKKS